MTKPYKSYVPKTVGEVHDLLGWMVLEAPRMEGNLAYFPGRNIDTEFTALNEGLELIRAKLGEEAFAALKVRSDDAYRHFKADPEDKTGDTDKGRACLFEMEDILSAKFRREQS